MDLPSPWPLPYATGSHHARPPAFWPGHHDLMDTAFVMELTPTIIASQLTIRWYSLANGLVFDQDLPTKYMQCTIKLAVYEKLELTPPLCVFGAEKRQRCG